MSATRERDGLAVHDNGIIDPSGCPRQRTDCSALARYASPGFESFMCCGATSAAPVPTDRLRLCIKSTHEHGVDVLVNLDERDAVHTSSVLLAGLSALGSVRIEASDTLRVPSGGEEGRHVCGVRGFDGMQGDTCPACAARAPRP